MGAISKYKSYRKKWLGKAVDYDGVYGKQCVDLVKHFTKDFMGVTLGSFSGSALSGWETGSPFDTNWKKVKYSEGKSPKLGDIVFFDKTKANAFGHVAIALWGNKKLLALLEQNAGNWSGEWMDGDEIREKIVTYSKPYTCLGWYTYIWK